MVLSSDRSNMDSPESVLEEIYRRADGLDRVWRYDIMPLLEDLFYGQRDLAEQYGVPGLRKAVAPAPPEP